MALAGPVASLAIAGLFGILWLLGPGVSESLHALAGWLAGGNWADGLWIAVIGWFLLSAATSSDQQLALQDDLAAHTTHKGGLESESVHL
jgi:membrane associated rhomboid family serine protease